MRKSLAGYFQRRLMCACYVALKRGCLGAPDGIIKIVSPSTTSHNPKTKFDLYAEHGVGKYWIVFPGEQTISVYVLEGSEYQPKGNYYEPGLLSTHTLPDLQLE